MRQKADKLEKGKWYADSNNNTVFLRFSHEDESGKYFDKATKFKYMENQRGLFGFNHSYVPFYIPTQEDIEKYNLNETE